MNKCDKEELINMLLQNLDEELKIPEKWRSSNYNTVKNITIYSDNFDLNYHSNGCIVVRAKWRYLTKIDENYSKFEYYVKLIKTYACAYMITYNSAVNTSIISKDSNSLELLPAELQNEEECVRLSKLLNLPTEETELDKLIKIYERVLEPLKQEKLKQKLDQEQKDLEKKKLSEEKFRKQKIKAKYDELSFFGKIIYNFKNRKQ